MSELTHFNEEGRARMVDVSEKAVTTRIAKATAAVSVNPETFRMIKEGKMKKGDVLAVAQVAGIMGAKRTPDIIPMCHPIQITNVDISFELDEASSTIKIISTAKCDGKTGIEMEAMSAASIAALTIYDMCKAVQRDIRISDIYLLEKDGGKSGHYLFGE
ncbi:MAG: cyclic pyranopterin monophosphate synthase MoaC [Parasporobacterium sp.]|nr:cyclic pyranopterin monophosphate synthase MoaC [Parasporobacterium sp.]